MLSLGTTAPRFSLPDTKGAMMSLEEFSDAEALVVMFICNHCPFVKHVLDGLIDVVKDYQQKGAAFVGINSNDVESYPEDSPENMAQLVREKGVTFPYLVDSDQKVAQAYRAACTPDFFVFDGERKLVYRGRMDGSRPGNDIPVTGDDLKKALDAVLGGEEVALDQNPSMGCNIKWKRGNEPEYFQFS